MGTFERRPGHALQPSQPSVRRSPDRPHPHAPPFIPQYNPPPGISDRVLNPFLYQPIGGQAEQTLLAQSEVPSEQDKSVEEGPRVSIQIPFGSQDAAALSQPGTAEPLALQITIQHIFGLSAAEAVQKIQAEEWRWVDGFIPLDEAAIDRGFFVVTMLAASLAAVASNIYELPPVSRETGPQ